APVRHAGEYYVPVEHHNPMELYACTVFIDPDGRLTVHDKTQGLQNVQRYLSPWNSACCLPSPNTAGAGGTGPGRLSWRRWAAASTRSGTIGTRWSRPDTSIGRRTRARA